MSALTRKTVNISLRAYEGPLDLLLSLIEKNEINIYDIPIAELTDQYISHIQDFSDQMEEISGFLVMAATLLEIKSKMLLPFEPQPLDEASDPREDLVRQLVEYKRFKLVSDLLREKDRLHPGYAYRGPDLGIIEFFREQKNSPKEGLTGVTIERLLEIYKETLRRRELKTDVIRSGFRDITKDRFTVEEKMASIKTALERLSQVSFASLVKNGGRGEIIATFLALLELIKRKEAGVYQPRLRDDIYVLRYNREYKPE